MAAGKDINSVVVSGTVTREPFVSEKVVKFTVNVQSVTPNGQVIKNYINVTAFGKAAQYYGGKITEGMRLVIQGEMKVNSYTPRNSDKAVWETGIVMFNCSRLAAGGQPQAQQQQPAPPPEPAGGVTTSEDYDTDQQTGEPSGEYADNIPF